MIFSFFFLFLSLTLFFCNVFFLLYFRVQKGIAEIIRGAGKKVTEKEEEEEEEEEEGDGEGRG